MRTNDNDFCPHGFTLPPEGKCQCVELAVPPARTAKKIWIIVAVDQTGFAQPAKTAMAIRGFGTEQMAIDELARMPQMSMMKFIIQEIFFIDEVIP